MKAKLFLVMLAFGSLTFTSCTNCCQSSGVKVCKKDGYTKEQWKDIVDNCKESDNCECGI